MPSTDILDDVIIIDTPGTLDGSGTDRNYNFAEAMGWFARRAALIIIFFDVNKMGVSTEMKSVLDNIQGNEEKIRIVFNKSDTVDERDMAGSLAGLRHNLAKSMPTPEVPEVYVTSLDSLDDTYKTEHLWIGSLRTRLSCWKTFVESGSTHIQERSTYWIKEPEWSGTMPM